MAKTYVQLVNEVLKRVRESQVGQVTANHYSVLVSTYVNDAKSVVEDSWNWAALRNAAQFDLVPNTVSYDLSDPGLLISGRPVNERSKLQYHPDCHEPMAFDVSPANPFRLHELSQDEVSSRWYTDPNPSPVETPIFFSLEPGVDSLRMNLFELPKTTRSWRLYFKTPQPELVNDTDVLLVPWLPVVLLATNYALSEKGEEVGQPGNEAEKKYLTALSDAISLDYSWKNGSLDWKVL